jgi:hypothetical protein
MGTKPLGPRGTPPDVCFQPASRGNSRYAAFQSRDGSDFLAIGLQRDAIIP